MRIEELANKHAHDLPGYELVYFEEVAFPVWKVNLHIQVLSDHYLNVVDEFLLKLVDAGVGKVDQIAKILGIDEEFIRESAVKLLSNEVIRVDHVNQSLTITEKGKPVLELLKMCVPRNAGVSICVDGITGEFLPDVGRLLNSSQIRKIDIRTIHSSRQVEKPNDSNFNFNKFRLFYRDLTTKGYSNLPKGELIEVLEMERIWPLFKVMRVLTYYDKQNDQHQFAVFDRDTRANEYDGVLLALESSEELGVLPLEEDVLEIGNGESDGISFTSIITSHMEIAEKNRVEIESLEKELGAIKTEINNASYQNKNIEDLTSEVKRLTALVNEQKANTRLLRTFEHRPLLERSFQQAKKWVVIVSPWLDPVALNESLVLEIDKALQRRVRVIIIYGYPGELEESKKRKQAVVLAKLNDLKGKKHGRNLHVQNIGITHEKVLICDKKFVVVGSFNWLSFKGDKQRGLRLEKSVYTEELSVIEDALKDIQAYENVDKHMFE